MSEAMSQKHRAALGSIFASAFITIAKLVAGLLSGSLALISEAGHAALDTGATILTYFAVRAADKPADEDHPFGHHKFESVAALIETGLLFVLAVGVLIEAGRRLLLGRGAEAVDANWLPFAVLLVSIAIDAVRWRTLARVARETHSQALAADALHFSSDLVASVLVLIGLAVTRLGYPAGDTLAAIGVAVFIAIAGFRLGKRTIDTLVDRAPSDLSARMRAAVGDIEGVASVSSLRLRPAGATVHGDLQVAVSRTMPLERVAEVKQVIARALENLSPGNDVTITANPATLDSETVLERVLLIAARRHVPVHHVTIQEVDGQPSVSLDVEIDGRMSLGVAHEIASGLEAAIRTEIGGLEVETHIEPLEMEELAGRNAPAAVTDAIRRALEASALQTQAVKEPHNVRVRATGAGLVVNYHCRVDPALSVAATHDAVDRLDGLVRRDFPEIIRIVGHAEPLVR